MKTVLLAAVAAIALATPALADIDTTGGTTPNVSVAQPFGAPDTATYGQTFTAGAADNFIQSFSLFLGERSNGAGPLDFKGYIGTWDGSKVGSIVSTSTTVRTKNDNAITEYVFSTPDLAITAGGRYVAFLSISELAGQADSGFEMQAANIATPSEGFVFLNNGLNFSLLTTQAWNDFGGSDAALKVDFSEVAVGGNGGVPEPATWAMMLAGFGAMGAAVRRQRRTSVRFA